MLTCRHLTKKKSLATTPTNYILGLWPMGAKCQALNFSLHLNQICAASRRRQLCPYVTDLSYTFFFLFFLSLFSWLFIFFVSFGYNETKRLVTFWHPAGMVWYFRTRIHSRRRYCQARVFLLLTDGWTSFLVAEWMLR